VRLGLEALAVTDHDGCYGVVRFAEAARALGLPTIFGTELTLGRTTLTMGEADPGADPATGPAGRFVEQHLLVLARDPQGSPTWPGRKPGPDAGRGRAPRTSLDDLADRPARRPPLAGAHRVSQGSRARGSGA
jgi:hypothetical protein